MGWCISSSPNVPVGCLACSLILAIWARMVFVAWGPFRSWAPYCKLCSSTSVLLFTIACLSKPPACQLRFSLSLHVFHCRSDHLDKVFDYIGFGAGRIRYKRMLLPSAIQSTQCPGSLKSLNNLVPNLWPPCQISGFRFGFVTTAIRKKKETKQRHQF
jgi:hypothetical protein